MCFVGCVGFFKFDSNKGVIFCVKLKGKKQQPQTFVVFLIMSVCSGRCLEALGVFHLTILRLTVGKAPVRSV